MSRIRSCVIAAALAVVALGWTAAEAVPPQTLIADSVAEFSGTRGLNNWYYGYYRITSAHPTYVATPGGVDYFVQLPLFTTNANHLDENAWQFPGNAAPWTLLSAGKAHPNGTDIWSGASTPDWAIRRYVSEAAGQLSVNWSLSKDLVNGPGGNGVTGRIFHNGVQEDWRTIAWDNGTGVNVTTLIPGVQIGDFIDLALDATGTFSVTYAGGGGIGNGQSDMSNFAATITVPEPATLALLAAGALLAARRRRGAQS
jgi:hypothetical protein